MGSGSCGVISRRAAPALNLPAESWASALPEKTTKTRKSGVSILLQWRRRSILGFIPHSLGLIGLRTPTLTKTKGCRKVRTVLAFRSQGSDSSAFANDANWDL